MYRTDLFFFSIFSIALSADKSNSVKFVPCLSANLYVKTFIMMLTNNDYIHIGFVSKS